MCGVSIFIVVLKVANLVCIHMCTTAELCHCWYLGYWIICHLQMYGLCKSPLLYMDILLRFVCGRAGFLQDTFYKEHHHLKKKTIVCVAYPVFLILCKQGCIFKVGFV